ncbi:hypothetical protein [Nannocystis bainbridge]|uniref:Uncharacterized protein n=1 Tax=Nannocystis bainbridge TaxID=2995303 RepID=A0ABT5E027_9BACT|nr:hypothetical protein [Nannocystis bainbridge]MDC0718674.1 hypothetical protein [Nannocystis bainbridge]
MKLPSKGVLIRLCIYVPLLAYFGYMACQKYKEEQAEQAEQNAAPVLDGPKHTFTLPDGKSVEVVEISEDQARQMGLDPGARGPAGKAEAPAKPPDAADAKSPPPAPTPAN